MHTPGSHPPRVRGLKRGAVLQPVTGLPSHPPRVRGLKLDDLDRMPENIGRTPAGAWIETHKETGENAISGRTPRGCVD